MEDQGKVVVVACVDYRYNKPIPMWLRLQYGLREDEYIILKTEGAELTAESVEHSLEFVAEHKGISKIILISHIGCLYRQVHGLDDTKESHQSDIHQVVQNWPQKYECPVDAILAPAPNSDDYVTTHRGWTMLDLSTTSEAVLETVQAGIQ